MKYLILASMLAVVPLSWALDQAGQQQLDSIEQRWAHIQYQMPKDQRPAAFQKLAGETGKLTQQEPKAAEAWIWDGIVTSSWAGATGGIGALGKVKAARSSLEKALALDPDALQGSAYTSLGALYDQVPGWPIGFGSTDKAEKMLKKALQLNPDGIDSNYFWADHLYRQGHYKKARAALQKALQAKPRPGRWLADQGRRGEIQALLKKIDERD